ncbi:MAG TPA: lyase family protein [Thermomicrobiales bacterium]|nr:lyase family protein [Thermomicrobiales bacterium]
MASFDIRANLRNVAERAQERIDAAELSGGDTRDLWSSLVLVTTSHVQHLLRSEIIDDGGFVAIARALDTALSAPPAGLGHLAQVKDAEERIDAILPQAFAGAATLGASRVETLATALRMTWRSRAARIHEEIDAFRNALLVLAEHHAVTIMAATWDRRPAAPTTLAHFLGGAIGPLGPSTIRLQHAIDAVDRSPFGAGVLAGDVLEADRERFARELGFREPIGNTLDALASVEDFVELAEALGASLAISHRLVNELLVWIRTDPTSFFLDERWESFPEPSMPALSISEGLETLRLELEQAMAAARGAIDLLRGLPYGPLGAAWNVVAPAMDDLLDRSDRVVTRSTAAIHEALIVNRAYLANRAGRMYTTISDLVPFLMSEEALPPTAARQISALVVARLREANLEASAVTPDMIDSAAVMVIGQELKVEMEALGRYLAPRRFIERRQVLGSPAPERAREWLASERERLAGDREWLARRRATWSKAEDALIAALASAAQDDEG